MLNTARAQAVFDPPILSEDTYSQYSPSDICHNFSDLFQFTNNEPFSSSSIANNFLIATSVTSISSLSVVELRRLDDANNLIYENIIKVGNPGRIRDLEASFTPGDSIDEIRLFITYYQMDGVAGFYRQIRKWNFMNNTIDIGQPQLIDASETYGRISQTVMMGKLVAFCWEKGGSVYGQYGAVSGGSPILNNYFHAVFDTVADEYLHVKLPDITFSQAPNDNKLQIAFVVNGNVDVWSTSLLNTNVVNSGDPVLFSSSTTGTALGGVLPANFTWPVSDTDYFASSKMNIAGYLNNGFEGAPGWAVVYNKDDNAMNDVVLAFDANSSTYNVLTNNSIPTLPAINGSLNAYPCVSFDGDDFITVVWYNDSLQQFVGYNYNLNGIPLNTHYSLVSPIHSAVPLQSRIASLSSFTHYGKSMLCSYPLDVNKMMYKIVPVIQQGFKPIPDNDDTREMQAVATIAPNPFTNAITLSARKQDAVWNLRMMDIAGKEMLSLVGNTRSVNTKLQALDNLPAGFYLLNLSEMSSKHTQFFKLIKQ